VNRTRAIGQLKKIHSLKYARAVRRFIPIVDNVLGLGKSTIADHYISKLSEPEYWENTKETDEFRKTITACHTIRIEFNPGVLCGKNLDAVMLM
jgi:hypothetical protein